MSDYSMPVLSEQEREALISLAKIEVKRWKSCADQQRGGFMVELMEIALAALTAKPVDPADCFCEVYLAPPVPVKQEGEQ